MILWRYKTNEHLSENKIAYCSFDLYFGFSLGFFGEKENTGRIEEVRVLENIFKDGWYNEIPKSI